MLGIKRTQQVRCLHLWGSLALILVMATPVTVQATDVKLPIQWEEQEGSNWCGCACITAILNRYLTDYPEFPMDPGADTCDEIGQCAVLNRGHGLTNCCDAANPCNSEACGVTGGVVESFLEQWGVDATTLPHVVLDFDDYMAQIDAGKPVVVHVSATGLGGHNMLGVGYNNDSGNEDMYMMDPAGYTGNTGIRYTSYADVISGAFDRKGRPWTWTVTMDNSPTSETIRLRCATHGLVYTYRSTTTSGRIIAGSDDGHEFEVGPDSAIFEAKDRIVLKDGFRTEPGANFRAIIVP